MYMKANELMIGDWVFYGKQPYPYQVKLIGQNLVKLDGLDNSIELDEISPVLITPELLEKNDWKRHAMSDGFKELEYWTSPDKRIELRSNKNGYMCNTDDAWGLHIDNEDFETLGGGSVTHLHELQNAFNCNRYGFEWKLK